MTDTPVCRHCGRLGPEVVSEVHGHLHCHRCGRNVAPCCEGPAGGADEVAPDPNMTGDPDR